MWNPTFEHTLIASFKKEVAYSGACARFLILYSMKGIYISPIIGKRCTGFPLA